MKGRAANATKPQSKAQKKRVADKSKVKK